MILKKSSSSKIKNQKSKIIKTRKKINDPSTTAAAGSNTAQTALATVSGPVPGPGPDTVAAAVEQGRDENVHAHARADTAVVESDDSADSGDEDETADDGAERPQTNA